MAETKIEWCDAVWNPSTGCTPVSPGCENCYARGFAPAAHPEALEIPLKWRKRRRIFVDSMGDLFHEQIPDEFIDRVFAAMALCPHHMFLVLTKREKRMYDWYDPPHDNREEAVGHQACVMSNGRDSGLLDWPLPNVWLGVTVEDVDYARRIGYLAQTPAALRFVSLEPLLGPVDISPELRSDSIHWVIVGGESGPHARPMYPDWVRSLRDQCAEAHVPFFLKQLTERGRKIPFDQWPIDLQVREAPDAAR